MLAHHGPIDKSAEAEKRFTKHKMEHESEKALQTYCNIMIRNITEMGSESSFSSKVLWDTYLAGLPGNLRRTATGIYATEKAAYDGLNPIGRITKISGQAYATTEGGKLHSPGC